MVGKIRWDIRPFITWIEHDFLLSVKVGSGAADYAQAPWSKNPGLYGTADAACVLYGIDRLDTSPASANTWLTALGAYQDTGSGLFVDDTATLAVAHNTGFAVAAMNLFDGQLRNGVRPHHLLRFAALTRNTAHAELFANTLDWRTNCYEAGEILTGLAATFHNVAGVVQPDWFDWLIKYIEGSRLDTHNGMVGVGKPATGDLDQIGGTFHFDFLWAARKRTLPHPTERATALLGLQRTNGMWDENNPWWLTFDAVYMLGRTLPLVPKDTADRVRAAIARAVTTLAARAADIEHRKRDFVTSWMGVHTLTGAVAFFAYAQQVLGTDSVITERPLRFVLDRRPYI